MRNTVYGLALQLFQSLYYLRADDLTLSSEIRVLLGELSTIEVVRLFGLTPSANTSEYAAFDGYDSRSSLEGLSRWLLKAMAICAGNTGTKVHSSFSIDVLSPIRSCKCLASEVDGSVDCYRFPIVTKHPATSIHRYGVIGVLGRR